MANYEINEEQEVLTKAMRMIETGDPVHADVYNVLFSALLNNDVFLEKLANKMVQQAMISHVMDSTNSNMVLGADQGPVITKLIDKVQEQVTVLNTKTEKIDMRQILLPNTSALTIKSSKEYDTIMILGQRGGKVIVDIIPLNNTDATVIHLGNLELAISDITTTSVTVSGLIYTDCRAIAQGILSVS